jgi:hypothetical protein
MAWMQMAMAKAVEKVGEKASSGGGSSDFSMDAHSPDQYGIGGFNTNGPRQSGVRRRPEPQQVRDANGLLGSLTTSSSPRMRPDDLMQNPDRANGLFGQHMPDGMRDYFNPGRTSNIQNALNNMTLNPQQPQQPQQSQGQDQSRLLEMLMRDNPDLAKILMGR